MPDEHRRSRDVNVFQKFLTAKVLNWRKALFWPIIISLNILCMTRKDLPNYCHDPEIIAAANRVGIRDQHVINRALSIGEAGAYRYTEASEGFLAWVKSCVKKNKENQPKKRLSKKQKQQILAKSNTNGAGE